MSLDKLVNETNSISNTKLFNYLRDCKTISDCFLSVGRASLFLGMTHLGGASLLYFTSGRWPDLYYKMFFYAAISAYSVSIILKQGIYDNVIRWHKIKEKRKKDIELISHNKNNYLKP